MDAGRPDEQRGGSTTIVPRRQSPLRIPISGGQMRDYGSASLSVLVRLLCLFAPLSLFLVIVSFDVLDAWHYEVAGCIVFAWSIVVFYRMQTTRWTTICKPLRRGFLISFVEHAPVLGLAALVLDGGFTFYACILATMFYWMMAGVCVASRPLQPAPLDVVFVTHGVALLAFGVSFTFWTILIIRDF
jgi:hypothetical protein